MDRTKVRRESEGLETLTGEGSAVKVVVTERKDGSLRIHLNQGGPGEVFLVSDKEEFLFAGKLVHPGAVHGEKVDRRVTPGRVLGGDTKLKIRLVPMEAIKAIARVLGWSGSGKYEDWDWLTKYTVEDCWESAMRHMMEGPTTLDEESGLPHLEHALTRLAMAIELKKRGAEAPQKQSHGE